MTAYVNGSMDGLGTVVVHIFPVARASHVCQARDSLNFRDASCIKQLVSAGALTRNVLPK